MRSGKILRGVLIGALLLLVVLGRGAVVFFTDWWWYREIQNTVYFFKSIELKLLMFAAIFVLMAAPSIVTLMIAKRLAPLRIRVLDGNLLEFPEHFVRPYLFPLLYGIIVFVSLLTASQAFTNWTVILPLFSHPLFNIADPIFHRDISFYLFYLPILETLYQLLLVSFFLAIIIAAVAYGIQKVLNLGPEGIRMAPVVSIHLSILLAIFAFVKAFGYRLGMFGLLLGQQGSVYGIGYADDHARLPLLTILAAVSAFVGLLLLINIKLHDWKPVIGGGLLWLLLSFTLFFYPRIIQQFQVIPSELDKERPYLVNNIEFTRKAYAIDTMKETKIEPSGALSKEEFETHSPTLENIRLWDRDPLIKSLAQLQEIRPYYNFMSVDVDRYWMGEGHLRQVMISPRELDYGRLQNPTWANEHLIFTHGYGFVAAAVNQVTSEGLPDFFVKNIPPAGAPELHVENPELYFGEGSNDYSIVNSRQEEFNYPSGDINKYTHYHGSGGVQINSTWKRLLYAYRFSTKIFFSSDIDQNSRILYYRGIAERLNKAFPLLIYDQDPYLVVDKGRLYWICDAYTVNDHYPYAHPVTFHLDRYNYIRNSVKVIVDAYNGTTTYYSADPSDPMLQLYQANFPGLFHSLSEMPPGLRQHIRVPEDFFMAQAAVYALYHMTNPDVFYNREDLWQFPHPTGDEEIRPYYVIMQVPGDTNPEFLLMLPFTPGKKDNLAAWVAARCDEDHYGERLVFEFPKESLVYGPSQIQARINQDPKFSQLRTLWGQEGSRINLGHLQVIPVGNSILYVEPLYLKAEKRELPELKLVLLAYGDKIVMEETLEKGLAALFTSTEKTTASSRKTGTVPVKPMLDQSTQEELQQALARYHDAMDAERRGDWTGYGQQIEALGEILQSLSKKNSPPK